MVYKITNNINNKVYIGLTTKTLEERWKQHINAAYSPRNNAYSNIFKKAIRKYGSQNFSLEILAHADTLDDLKRLECHYIDAYNSFAFNEPSGGYNATLGGDLVKLQNCKAVTKLDIITGKIIAEYSSISEAISKECKGINESCSNPNTPKSVKGYCYFYSQDLVNLTDEQIIEKVHSRYPKLLYQLDTSGNIIKLWRGPLEASRALNCSEGNIVLVCQGKRRLAAGFQWCYYKDRQNYINKNIREIKTTAEAIAQYDLTGKFIKDWSSITSAAVTLGITDSKICACCKGKRNKAGNYQWRYLKDAPISLNNIVKPQILCIETNVLYETVNQAVKDLNLTAYTIKQICAGLKNHPKYNFKYVYDI